MSSPESSLSLSDLDNDSDDDYESSLSEYDSADHSDNDDAEAVSASDNDGSLNSLSQSEAESTTTVVIRKHKNRLFSAAQKAALRRAYLMGMKGTGRKLLPLIEKVGKETGLTTLQIINWIKKKNHRRKHARPKESHNPVAKKIKLTSWHIFQKEFGESDAGKIAMSKGVGQFNVEAKEKYEELTSEQINELREKSKESEKIITLTSNEIKAEGKRIFNRIEKECNELERIGYSGFAFGFFEDEIELVGTSNTKSCMTPSVLGYLHALVKAANPPPLPTTSESTLSEEQRQNTTSKTEACKQESQEDENSTRMNITLSKTSADKVEPKNLPTKPVRSDTLSKKFKPANEDKPKKQLTKDKEKKQLTKSVDKDKPKKQPTKPADKNKPKKQPTKPVHTKPADKVTKPKKQPTAAAKPVRSDTLSKTPANKIKQKKQPTKPVHTLSKKPPEPESQPSIRSKHDLPKKRPKSSESDVDAPSKQPKRKRVQGEQKDSEELVENNASDIDLELGNDRPTEPDQEILGDDPLPTEPDEEREFGDDQPTEPNQENLGNENFDQGVSACTPVLVSSSPVKDGPDTWVANLTISDKLIIENNEWLNDSIIIFVSMKLLDMQSKDIYGWQSPQNGKFNEFKPIPPSSKFIQIFHVNDNHWVTVSNVRNVELDALTVYDSKSRDSMSIDFQEQICSLVRPRFGKVILDIARVELQENDNDCGVYAIAFATELVLNHDPVLSVWKKEEMRSHLCSCLENGEFSRFPILKTKRGTFGCRIKASIPVKIQCNICHMPNKKSKPMIRCGICHQMYHKECVESSELISRGIRWKCKYCNELSEIVNK